MKEVKLNRKVFSKIEEIRLVNVVIYLDNEIVYDGNIDIAPDEFKELKYSEIEMGDKVILKCYTDAQD